MNTEIKNITDKIKEKNIFIIKIKYRYITKHVHSNSFFNYEIEKELNLKKSLNISNIDKKILKKFIDKYYMHVCLRQSKIIDFEIINNDSLDITQLFFTKYEDIKHEFNFNNTILLRNLCLLKLFDIFNDKQLLNIKTHNFNDKFKNYILNQLKQKIENN